MAKQIIQITTQKSVLDGTEMVEIQEAAGGTGSSKKATTQAIADLASSGSVTSVFGRSGVVIAADADYQGTQIVYDKTGDTNITVATRVQAAIKELDAAIPQTAIEIGFDPTGLTHVTSGNVQGAIAELDTAIGTGGGGGGGTDLGGNVINVIDYGAVGNGSTSDSAAFVSAFAALGAGDTLLIPAGSYNLSSITDLVTLTISASNISITGLGRATLTFGANGGISFTGASQTDVRIENLSFAGTGTPISRNATTNVFRRFTVKNCRFSVNTTLSDLIFINLNCVGYGHTVTGCTFNGINQGSAGNCVAVWLGRTDPTHAYGYTDLGVPEGGHVVSENVFEGMISFSASGEGHHVLAYGYGNQIIHNTFDFLITSQADCEGVYIKGPMNQISHNTFKAAGANAWIMTKGGTGTHANETLIQSNSFYGANNPPDGIIKIEAGNARVEDNQFIGAQATTALVSATTTTAGRVIVDRNYFYNCRSVRHIHLRTSYSTAIGNHIVGFDKALDTALDFGIIGIGPFSSGTMTGVRVEDNQISGSTLTAGTTPYCRLIWIDDQGGTGTLINLSVKRNRLLNVYGPSLTLGAGKLFLIWAFSQGTNHIYWHITDNYTDELLAEIFWTFGPASAAFTPVGYEVDMMFPAVYSVGGSGVFVLRGDWSGLHINNASESSATTMVPLPAAIPGLTFTYTRLNATYAFRAEPNGTDTIGNGGAGKYIELQTNHASIVLKCYSAGTWTIVHSTGTTAYEP